MANSAKRSVGTKTVPFIDIVDSTQIERHGEHRPNFELSDALAEQLKLR